MLHDRITKEKTKLFSIFCRFMWFTTALFGDPGWASNQHVLSEQIFFTTWKFLWFIGYSGFVAII